MSPSDKIREAARKLQKESGVGARRLEVKLGLKKWTLRGLLDSKRTQAPSVDRAAEICQAIGLEFYIGPSRGHVVVTPAKLEQPQPSWVEELRSEIREALGSTIERAATRQVEVRELAAAAGGGATVLDETVTGYVSFQRSWLDRHGLDATECTIINVVGESMEPTLLDGSKILVDRSQHRRRQGCVYVVQTDDGLVVKRAEKDENGFWILTSDNEEPEYSPITWRDVEIIGEVRWAAKTFA